jgi:hypothetical protein
MAQTIPAGCTDTIYFGLDLLRFRLHVAFAESPTKVVSMASTHRRRTRGGQPGHRPLREIEIPVVDTSGDQILVIQREHWQSLPGLGAKRKLVSYSLETGELVEPVDDDTFLLKGRGKKFVRVK